MGGKLGGWGQKEWEGQEVMLGVAALVGGTQEARVVGYLNEG